MRGGLITGARRFLVATRLSIPKKNARRLAGIFVYLIGKMCGCVYQMPFSFFFRLRAKAVMSFTVFSTSARSTTSLGVCM